MRDGVPRTGVGRTRAYLGRCRVEDVWRCRERFGGVTLQGMVGLRIARALDRAGELHGVDLDPAVYRNRPVPAATAQLTLPGLDCAPFDWVAAQAELGLPVVRTAGARIRVGRVDELRAELARSYPVAVSVVLALDAGWLGRRHIDALEEALRAADRDVSLLFAAAYNPLDTVVKIESFRRLLRWAAGAHRDIELLRTDLTALPAVIEGATVAAIGFSTSTRHLGIPFGPRQREAFNRRRRSPLVFVPRLLHWQRANVLGALAAWDGAGVTYCECPVCARAGHDLLRFDTIPAELEHEVRDHDEHALAMVIDQIMAATDPAAELKFRRTNAVQRGRSIAAALDVGLDSPPAWLDGWN
ncbi:MAG TPA: hypothetical protein VFV67_09180 [Actinophytocola sp.]|uniref:hypothetical protein n=1 Tax=Actinophytocola sp. TaxID=1872138 RepID=UPI002DB6300F|nr:hypothetical protein [Actinophytocola sp.]HEU5470814.1 hypothetical protein [Actinophytocola sp.]